MTSKEIGATNRGLFVKGIFLKIWTIFDVTKKAIAQKPILVAVKRPRKIPHKNEAIKLELLSSTKLLLIIKTKQRLTGKKAD